MIGHLSGQIIHKTSNFSVIDCHGVGYEVHHTVKAAQHLHLNQAASLFIHTHVREDAFILFGFLSDEERQVFRELTKVNGIGPRLALSILSTLSLSELKDAISHKNLKLLQSVPGIGKKTAERICIDLRDRLTHLSDSGPEASSENVPSMHHELESVLFNLGYQRPDILRVLKLVMPQSENKTFEEIVRSSLKELAQGRIVQ